MRTTIVLDDDLFRQAKRRAAASGRSFSDLVSAALREELREHPPKRLGRFRMPTFGGPSPQRHDPDQLTQALEDDDRAGLRG